MAMMRTSEPGTKLIWPNLMPFTFSICRAIACGRRAARVHGHVGAVQVLPGLVEFAVDDRKIGDPAEQEEVAERGP